MKIAFLTRSLMGGGAERQLVVLACRLARRGHGVFVITLYGGGPFIEDLRANDVTVLNAKKTDRWDLLSFVRLVRTLKAVSPDVIYSFVAAQNVLAAVLRPFVPESALVWGIRASDQDLSAHDRLTRLLYSLERVFSSKPELVICNSVAGREHVLAQGFPEDKTCLVLNGIDTERFQFSAMGRSQLRAGWGVTASDVLIGIVARLDPMKDHSGFLSAARRLAAQRDDVKFLCVGKGTESLLGREEAKSLGGRLICLPARDDLPAVYSAMDILCSSSISEGFSNVIAEAMACETKCVVTDVGDSARIVGCLGSVVPAADPEALADALGTLAVSGQVGRDPRARARVDREYGLDVMVDSAERLLSKAIEAR